MMLGTTNIKLFRNLYATYNKDTILDYDVTTAHKGIAVSQTREHSLFTNTGTLLEARS